MNDTYDPQLWYTRLPINQSNAILVLIREAENVRNDLDSLIRGISVPQGELMYHYTCLDAAYRMCIRELGGHINGEAQ